MMAVSLVLSSVERLELEHRCASRYIVNNELIEEFIIMGSNKLKIEIHNFLLVWPDSSQSTHQVLDGHRLDLNCLQ